MGIVLVLIRRCLVNV